MVSATGGFYLVKDHHLLRMEYTDAKSSAYVMHDTERQ